LNKPEENTLSKRENVFSAIRYGRRVYYQKAEGLFMNFTREGVSSNLSRSSQNQRLTFIITPTVRIPVAISNSGRWPPWPATLAHRKTSDPPPPTAIRPETDTN
jgi:hypothetical protein